jgi:exosortase E/protease (VPEID-CTERM system)
VLGLFFDERLYHEADHTLGVGEFLVHVTRFCSGYEGIVLFLGFVSYFLALFRAQLRFPRVLLILPIGAAVIWGLNGLRIAALVGLGAGVSPELAIDGFHAAVGWPLIAAVALGAVALAWRMPFFSAAASVPRSRAGTVNVNAVYLMPLIAGVVAKFAAATLALSQLLGSALAAVAVAIAVWVYRRELRIARPTLAVRPVLIGVLAAAAWVLLSDLGPGSAARWTSGADMPGVVVWIASVLSLVGFIVMAPLAEELAFRGFLLRRLVSRDFESVHARESTVFAILGSSVVFGVVHQAWVAATVCGVLYAWSYRLRGRLGDAVLAHGATNAALLIVAAVTGEWGWAA